MRSRAAAAGANEDAAFSKRPRLCDDSVLSSRAPCFPEARGPTATAREARADPHHEVERHVGTGLSCCRTRTSSSSRLAARETGRPPLAVLPFSLTLAWRL